MNIECEETKREANEKVNKNKRELQVLSILKANQFVREKRGLYCRERTRY